MTLRNANDRTWFMDMWLNSDKEARTTLSQAAARMQVEESPEVFAALMRTYVSVQILGTVDWDLLAHRWIAKHRI